MQREGGIWSVLGAASIYSSFQDFLGADAARRAFVARHVRPHAGMRILDVGCGPSDIFAHLDQVTYVGVDRSSNYIAAAKAKFGHRGTFICGDVTELKLPVDERFDVVLAIGLLHHLSDAEAISLMSSLTALLSLSGRFVTVDPVKENQQHPIARLMISLDRGKNVRTKEQYVSLLRSSFRTVEAAVYRDLMRIPYSHLIAEARSSGD